MELSQLKYFCTLAKLEHFTRASEALHITQPALSKAISNLETELGLLLFDRTGKQVHLNSAGQVFLSKITPILDQLDDVTAFMSDLSSGTHGHLRIGSTFQLETSSTLQQYFQSFFRQYPDIAQHRFIYNRQQIEQLLLERRLDFGFTLEPPSDSGIDWEQLYTERLGIVVGKDHPLANRSSISLKEVENERFLSNLSATDNRDTARYICKLAGYEANIVYEGDDTPFISQAVAEGYGVTFLPEEKFFYYKKTTGEAVWQKNLRFLHVEDIFAYRPIFILYLNGRYQSAVGQNFVEGLKAYINTTRQEPQLPEAK